MKSKALYILFIIQSFMNYSQENNEPLIEEFDVFYDYTHWGFSVTPVVYQGVEFSKITSLI